MFHNVTCVQFWYKLQYNNTQSYRVTWKWNICDTSVAYADLKGTSTYFTYFLDNFSREKKHNSACKKCHHVSCGSGRARSSLKFPNFMEVMESITKPLHRFEFPSCSFKWHNQTFEIKRLRSVQLKSNKAHFQWTKVNTTRSGLEGFCLHDPPVSTGTSQRKCVFLPCGLRGQYRGHYHEGHHNNMPRQNKQDLYFNCLASPHCYGVVHSLLPELF